MPDIKLRDLQSWTMMATYRAIPSPTTSTSLIQSRHQKAEHIYLMFILLWRESKAHDEVEWTAMSKVWNRVRFVQEAWAPEPLGLGGWGWNRVRVYVRCNYAVAGNMMIPRI
ncbi:predicted protein [Aspergillus nidulans FGSC A4]|nr:predicted protein [Aspergillus nidulans FGSC A4]|eukprot:XP_681947.1 predicted protein [Aspergillus nidulans FGSC A4]